MYGWELFSADVTKVPHYCAINVIHNFKRINHHVNWFQADKEQKTRWALEFIGHCFNNRRTNCGKFLICDRDEDYDGFHCFITKYLPQTFKLNNGTTWKVSHSGSYRNPNSGAAVKETTITRSDCC